MIPSLFHRLRPLGHSPRLQPPRWTAPLMACTLIGIMLGITSCALGPTDERAREVEPPPLTSVHSEPMLRVRVERNTNRIRIGASSLRLRAADGGSASYDVTGPIDVRHEDGRFVVQDGEGAAVRWRGGALRVEPRGESRLRVGDLRYPGALVLVANDGGRFDAINHVPLERYLPGVLDHELYDGWEPEAYVAQAVAARSYALFERSLNGDRHYDLESTVASQVYGGESTNLKAVQAVRRTRGLVLSYAGRVVPAFYSSCCGGASQDAVAAFPHLGENIDIPPLRGGQRGGWCSASSKYRWGSVVREADPLARRIAAWGRATEHPVAGLQGLQSVAVSKRSRSGRPAVFTLTDGRGRRFELPAEKFRFACNYAGGGAGKLPRDQQVWSSFFEPTVRDGQVTFAAGRGFGHGVGMCQWGAQGLAERGNEGLAIVAHFYPEARIVKLY